MNNTALHDPRAPAHVHPWAFMVLIIPFGVVSGYLTVAIAWQLKQAGLSVEQVAGIIALSYIPHVWKFVWAPIADSTPSRAAQAAARSFGTMPPASAPAASSRSASSA